MKAEIGLLAHPAVGLHGAAIMAIEEARALLSAGRGLVFVASDKVEFADPAIDGSQEMKWTFIPRELPFPKELSGKFPRYAAGWLKQRLLDELKIRSLKKLELDLLFVNSFIYSHEVLSKYMEGRYRKKALVVHESAGHFAVHEKWRMDMALDALDRYDMLIFTAESSRREWQKIKGTPLKSSRVIPNCAREDLAASLVEIDKKSMKKRLGLRDDAFIAVQVANIQRRKGQDVVLDNLEAMKKVAPDLNVLFIGPPAYDGDSLAKRIENETPDWISWLGPKKNEMDYIRAADVLLLPSRAEVMPLTILEAMVLGTPAIASNVDGIPELIDDGENGLLFPISEPDKMVAAIEKMYSSAELRNRLAKEATSKYWSYFSRERMARAYREVVEELLGR